MKSLNEKSSLIFQGLLERLGDKDMLREKNLIFHKIGEATSLNTRKVYEIFDLNLNEGFKHLEILFYYRGEKEIHPFYLIALGRCYELADIQKGNCLYKLQEKYTKRVDNILKRFFE